MSHIQFKNVHRLRDPETNPCLKETDLTTRCLEENNYVQEMCGLTFKNYSNCMTYWNNIMKQRKLAKIKPYMPGVLERKLIKAQRDNGKNVISAPTDD